MGCYICKEIRIDKKKMKDFSPPNEKLAKIGKFLYLPNDIEKRNRVRWETNMNKERSIEKVVAGLRESKYYKGFPQLFRWEAWKRKMNVKTDPIEYQNLDRASEFSYEIKKDIYRTFPHHPYFDAGLYGHIGQNALLRILEKFAHKWTDVGYCQGMNFVVGFLLMVSGGKEAEVFAFLEAIYHNFQLSEIFKEDMTGLRHHLWVFDKLFEKKLSKLYLHFRCQDISEDLWALKWFLTLFTVGFPENITVFIWDLIILEGFDSIYKLALAVLKINQEKLLKMNTYEIVNFLSGDFIQCPPQSLLKRAKKFNFNKSARESYEKEWKCLPEATETIGRTSEKSQSEASSPKVTVQTVVEEPPVMIRRNRGFHNTGNWQVINPFLVSVDGSFERSNLEESFNAEDILNNLVNDSDWNSL